MKATLLTTTLALAVVAPLAFAQPTGLTGFYGQAGLGLGSSNMKTTTQTTESNVTETETLKYGESNVAGTLALGYNHGFSNGFNLGANIFYNFSNSNAGGATEFEGAESEILNARLKNIWGISVEPGYAFSDQSLGYLKLGWAQASSSLQTTKVTATESTNTTINFGNSNGFLYGLGFKHLINKNVYVGVEFYQVLFGSKSRSVMEAGAEAGAAPQQYRSSPTYTYAGLVLGVRF